MSDNRNDEHHRWKMEGCNFMVYTQKTLAIWQTAQYDAEMFPKDLQR